MHKNFKTISTYFSSQYLKSQSMQNLQYDSLDTLMLNFYNHFLPIKQSCTMDLCYLHRIEWVNIKIIPEST